VQVLGMLEAIGQRFDHLWVMGLHDAAWPARPMPNPFLPLPLQRRAGLPRADEQRELAFASGVTERLLSAAGEVVVSSPQRDGDEALRPSPLIVVERCVLCSASALGMWAGESWLRRVAERQQFVVRDRDAAPAVTDEIVYGGSMVFKLQAACPFRAFAELRLGARPLQDVEIGLNAMARGSLLHDVLETVWGNLQTQARLLSVSPGELQDLVRAAVAEQLDSAARRFPDTFTVRFRELERERLVQQVLEWLELEKQRSPFRVIEREQKHDGQVAGVPVTLKFDRVDELEAGGRIVIDYKTGKVEASQWFGNRPDEPQLPLYVSMLNGDVAGVAFGQVQAGKIGFKGVTEHEGVLPNVKGYQKLQQTRELSSWAEVIEHWQRVLDELGADFLRGDAAVDPKQLPNTCTYCRLQPLCRIHETTPLDLEDETGGESS